MNAEEIASYVRELEGDNAILEKKLEKRNQKIRTLRDVNARLKYELDNCKALRRVRV
jgi:outer membrane murein-binding lipoprotein Lpp